MRPINLLLIGFGPHAQRIYFPITQRDGGQRNFSIVAAVDVQEKRTQIEQYLGAFQTKPELLYASQDDVIDDKLSQNFALQLNELIQRRNINAVIIATDPRVHKPYALWALDNHLSILMDKPITAVPHASTDIGAAQKILLDYKIINKAYQREKSRNSSIIFSLMAQRRFHPAYRKMRELISEVNLETHCPVTSIQSFHCDGQWRLPSEIVDIDYHSYNSGFGKYSHTGYHSIDIMHWLIEAAENSSKQINNIELFTSVTRPSDFFTQLNLQDYERVFPEFPTANRYSAEALAEKTQDFGEIDGFSTIAFKHDDQTVSLGSLNLVHNGFSQRGWLQPNIRDLYKGNGRLRHESHFIEQGPFQAISFLSYQSKEIDPTKKQGVYDMGGEYHLEINIFRNSTLFPHWKSYEKVTIQDLQSHTLDGYSRGHQEDARRACVLEFIDSLRTPKRNPTSDYSDHLRSVSMLSGLYQSAARGHCGKCPVVKMPFSLTC